jgi:hypothetical protein
MDFVGLLSLIAVEDLEVSTGGIRALHRPDRAPFAYEAKVIASVYDYLEKEKIPDFLDGANQSVFELLYRSCNGLHIRATKFSVFGFLVGDQSVGVPWDIELPNLATRNERPKATLIVGVGTERSSLGARSKCYHTIQSNPEILVTPHDDFSAVLRRYSTVEEWLRSEIVRALDDRDHW